MCCDALVEEIKAEADPALRAAKYAETEKTLIATDAVNPMHSYKKPRMMKSNVKNIAVLPTGDVGWSYGTIERFALLGMGFTAPPPRYQKSVSAKSGAFFCA